MAARDELTRAHVIVTARETSARRNPAPKLGRFLQPDPVRGDKGLYEYAMNSPISRLDPGGGASAHSSQTAA